MNRPLVGGLILLVLSCVVSADQVHSVNDCRQIPDNTERLTCFDAIAALGDARKAPVQLAKSFYNVLARDTSRGINAPRIELHVAFANATDKQIKGLSVLITIRDAYGDDVLVTDAKMDIDIAPHTQTSATPYFFWEDNEFDPGSAYRRIYNAVSNKTAQTDVVVKKILYRDGSVDSY
ncbi:hypothetical protein EN788_22200 [Mesorhizobium sp. M2D.F.Ca.ET.145.01.1.1]|uniref:hypothetical protein n=1 Tax=unclassified Mesorhizobium TaxID=325217 RepID=UPI000FCC64F2|nr:MULTISPECIES: hypothetical protein [unclassified Mesorhizobium]TGU44631.1 hypothetical protein EN789_21750 [bacterium M00.F.Ca.ET.146.01.1.1]TGU58459.1 hypothetical protein EN791_021750 [Mesorhizobium sp. M2D.F.Ca.ET.148.01.1.1]TGU64391.1 hypothetical protein EN790_21745 [Mesorhizobium sp. M2D.F.Ca.ET.147.01.1.1]TGW09967.1 hypothetical protein EN788_22200 [Mesorhizobium sp. M2D.F.Ca.ET.145.01.1.1]